MTRLARDRVEPRWTSKHSPGLAAMSRLSEPTSGQQCVPAPLDTLVDSGHFQHEQRRHITGNGLPNADSLDQVDCRKHITHREPVLPRFVNETSITWWTSLWPTQLVVELRNSGGGNNWRRAPGGGYQGDQGTRNIFTIVKNPF